MSDELRTIAQDLLKEVNALSIALQDAEVAIRKVIGKPGRLQFDIPIGTPAERAGAKIPPGAWFCAMTYALHYPNKNEWHTGLDLNLPSYSDSGQGVYACADGICRFAGVLPGWGKIIVVEHALEGGVPIYSRYAHLDGVAVAAGESITRGSLIAHIGEYGKAGPPEDHLHFDLARIDLGAQPADWPGADIERLRRDYIDPIAFIREHHQVQA
jgi:murein DD-endopeptidase MepM/ murein hydrolase activator NlpD